MLQSQRGKERRRAPAAVPGVPGIVPPERPTPFVGRPAEEIAAEQAAEAPPIPLPPPTVPAAPRETSIRIVSAPERVAPGEQATITWEVFSPVPTTITHTAIYYGGRSNPEQLRKDDTPADARYPSLTTEFVDRESQIPRQFTTRLRVERTAFYRALAIIDGEHYWTSERTLEVVSGEPAAPVTAPEPEPEPEKEPAEETPAGAIIAATIARVEKITGRQIAEPPEAVATPPPTPTLVPSADGQLDAHVERDLARQEALRVEAAAEIEDTRLLAATNAPPIKILEGFIVQSLISGSTQPLRLIQKTDDLLLAGETIHVVTDPYNNMYSLFEPENTGIANDAGLITLAAGGTTVVNVGDDFGGVAYDAEETNTFWLEPGKHHYLGRGKGETNAWLTSTGIVHSHTLSWVRATEDRDEGLPAVTGLAAFIGWITAPFKTPTVTGMQIIEPPGFSTVEISYGKDKLGVSSNAIDFTFGRKGIKTLVRGFADVNLVADKNGETSFFPTHVRNSKMKGSTHVYDYQGVALYNDYEIEDEAGFEYTLTGDSGALPTAVYTEEGNLIQTTAALPPLSEATKVVVYTR